MYGPGDVRFFRLAAPLYDRVMPDADRGCLAAGLRRADGGVDRVLDLGGGTGRASLALRDHAGLDPVVVDATPAMLARARDRWFEAVAGDAARLPVRDGAIDAAVLVDALHHFPDGRGALAEAFRAIRPGGVLVVREFDPTHPLGRALALGERLIGMDSAFRSPAELADAMATAGFAAGTLDEGFGYTVVGRVPEG